MFMTELERMVADYEVYVRRDASDFGAAVLPAKLGRYLRFVAPSEINGSALTSVAELDLVGTRQ
jgi:hypothetical protein